jgi:hypothetical protein
MNPPKDNADEYPQASYPCYKRDGSKKREPIVSFNLQDLRPNN